MPSWRRKPRNLSWFSQKRGILLAFAFWMFPSPIDRGSVKTPWFDTVSAILFCEERHHGSVCNKRRGVEIIDGHASSTYGKYDARAACRGCSSERGAPISHQYQRYCLRRQTTDRNSNNNKTCIYTGTVKGPWKTLYNEGAGPRKFFTLFSN